MVNTLTSLPARQAARYGDRTAYYSQAVSAGEFTPVSWHQFHRQTLDVAAGLEILGLLPSQMVAVFSANCAEILVTDFAAYANRAVPVSIYSTSSPEQVAYILRDSGAVIAFAGDEQQLRTLCDLAGECPALQQIVAYGDVPADLADRAMSFADLERLGQAATADCRDEVARRTAQAVPDDVATLIYTSGTTGEPKGAVLPHSCFDAAMRIHHERLTMISDADTSVCFLPLSHIFEKAWTYFCLDSGMQVYINRDPHVIQQTLRQVRPTCMCSVPRFWEKVYTAVQEKLGRTGLFKKLLMRRALRVGYRRNLIYKRTGRRVPRMLEWQYRFFDRKIFGPMRRVIGVDRGNIFPTAGAPLSAEIVKFMHCCGIDVLIGYGLSETTATVTCYPTIDYVIGSVGTPMPEVNVRIGADDEIQVKAPTVMRGYFNKPQATAEAFTADGWLRTGDASYFDEQGALVLTERIKDLFKTSNGKYIAPQAIESRLGEDRFIEQVAVIGDRRKYVTAIIIPAFEALKDYARRKKIAFTNNADLIRNADIRRLIEARIDKLQKDLAGYEKVKKFTLLPQEFTIDKGELTNTLKLRRPVINRHYADQIEAMYG